MSVAVAGQACSGGKSAEGQKIATHFNETITTASWYGKKFHGKTMSNGSPFDMYDLTMAHKVIPFGARVRLRYLRNDREITVTVTDRGPFVKGRGIDLSQEAAKRLGLLEKGTGRVKIVSVCL